MRATDSPAIIVARFLKANNYNDTLEAFISEAGLSSDAGTVEKGDLTIEKILEEKKVFDVSLSFEKVGIGEERGWSLPAPSFPTQVSTLPAAANLLHVSVESFENESVEHPSQMLFATTADRCLHLITPDETFTLFKSLNTIQDSPILSCVSVGRRYLTTISSGMSGQVVVYDHVQGKVVDERRDHKKYVVKIASWRDGGHTWVATAGWDAKILLYRTSSGQPSGLGAPVAVTTLPSNPETIIFVQHPVTDSPILLATRRESTSLYYYALPTIYSTSVSMPTPLQLLGTQNLAPHSNAWIAFSPSSVAICPTNPTLLAVATSALPHMKLIIVRLLLPPISSQSAGFDEPATQAAQTRANLARQDREDTAIQVHVSTLAPQTPYSTPQVAWRPDGTGVWVNGDDGVLRGLEAKTGKILATLKGGHEIGSKIRSIWCGKVDVDGGNEEWVVSGGFDRRLVVWKPAEENVGGG